MQLVRTDGAKESITLVDYLAIPSPRTSNAAVALREYAVRGHCGASLNAAREAAMERSPAFRVQRILSRYPTLGVWAGVGRVKLFSNSWPKGDTRCRGHRAPRT